MTKLRASAIALAGILAVAATTTSASAQWRQHHHQGGWGAGPGIGIGIGAGIAAGALIGSAVAAQPYGYYGEPGYAYAPPYAVEPGYAYAQPYAVGPTYYGNNYGYRNWGYGPCFTDEGYGRRTPCDASTR